VYLQTYLQQNNQRILTEIENTAKTVLERQQNEDAYKVSIINRYKIDIPVLDFNDIKKKDREEDVHGSQLVGQVFIPDRIYRVWVVTFQIPYSGNVKLLEYVPKAGSESWSPDMFTDNQYLCFEVRNAGRNLEQMKNDKERILSFIKTRSQNTTEELEAYNATLETMIQQTFDAFKKRYLDNKRNLDEL